jgi:adenosylhomocysteine nucleosidase
MPVPPTILVCFATREEAAPFRRLAPGHVHVLLTGIGPRNARRSLAEALRSRTAGAFALVVSSGFAGGLDPALPAGQIVFNADSHAALAVDLERLGARPAQFHCAPRIAVTAREKAALREATGADAVEMESLAIGEVCREHGVPCVTVRVISDTADEDLPLDFNRLYTPDYRLRPGKLAGALLRSPRRVAALWRFRGRISQCADDLAALLTRFATAHKSV